MRPFVQTRHAHVDDEDIPVQFDRALHSLNPILSLSAYFPFSMGLYQRSNATTNDLMILG
jgi:hypothetical protein